MSIEIATLVGIGILSVIVTIVGAIAIRSAHLDHLQQNG